MLDLSFQFNSDAEFFQVKNIKLRNPSEKTIRFESTISVEDFEDSLKMVEKEGRKKIMIGKTELGKVGHVY